MINIELLQEKMQKRGITQNAVSEFLNIPYSDFSDKLLCKKEFLISEIYSIAIVLELTPNELNDIFFSQAVESNSTNA